MQDSSDELTTDCKFSGLAFNSRHPVRVNNIKNMKFCFMLH